MPRSGQIDRMVGERVAAARSSNQYTKSRLASAMGITYQAYLQLERGNTAWTVGWLMAVAAELKIPITALIPPREQWP